MKSIKQATKNKPQKKKSCCLTPIIIHEDCLHNSIFKVRHLQNLAAITHL